MNFLSLKCLIFWENYSITQNSFRNNQPYISWLKWFLRPIKITQQFAEIMYVESITYFKVKTGSLFTLEITVYSIKSTLKNLIDILRIFFLQQKSTISERFLLQRWLLIIISKMVFIFNRILTSCNLEIASFIW